MARLAASRSDGRRNQGAECREASGAYRVMYVAKFEEAVYVLHCFQKKTQETSHLDKDIAQARYRAVVNARRTGK